MLFLQDDQFSLHSQLKSLLKRYSEALLKRKFSFCQCRSCGSDHTKPYVSCSSKGLNGLISQKHEYTFYKCQVCESLSEPSENNFFYEKEIDPLFTHYYIDALAGIDSMVEPLAALPIIKEATAAGDISFLELGCGYGIGIDFVKKIYKSSFCVGIEPGGWGREGGSMLGLDIEEVLLGKGSKFDKSQFDVIYASEVVEHLQHPQNFIKEIEYVSHPNSVVILTTPNAAYIKPSEPRSEVYSCLFPGEHKILFTAKTLSKLLHDNGFPHSFVLTRNKSSLVIYASKNKSIIEKFQNLGDKVLDRDVQMAYYQTYFESSLDKHDDSLEKTGKNPKQGIRRIFLAFMFRYFKELVNKGEIDKSIIVVKRLSRSLQDESFNTLALDVSKRFKFYQESSLSEDHSLLLSLLELCLHTMVHEAHMLSIEKQAYPRGSIAFSKIIGFYICAVLHAIQREETADIVACNFLTKFIYYTSDGKQSVVAPVSTRTCFKVMDRICSSDQNPFSTKT